MNRFAYLTTGLAIKTLSGLSRANIKTHGHENIPDGSIIFAVNHFTRIETMILPGYIYKFTNRTPVWSLADYTLFQGSLKNYLDKVGALSTRDPDRDLLIVKTLLTGEASWIIFPEGRMVKSKKIFEKGKFVVASEHGQHPPHTGAAALALRTEFYRQRIAVLSETAFHEVKRLSDIFGIDSIEKVIEKKTFIVPVNITYYPMRACENILSKLAVSFVDDITQRAVEEIMTEGTMLLAGVDLDIRFGSPIVIEDFMKSLSIRKDIASKAQIGFDDPLPSKKAMKKASYKIMQNYMAAIYQMTTVNHDHLFASIFKMMPYKRINPYDLRRRMFLAAEQYIKQAKVYSHTSLEADQLHLLTDDRYNKFHRFMSIALEKGFLQINNNFLEKQQSRLASVFDFHNVRLENPVAVMANEIEPLTVLQRKLMQLAWQPSFWIKRKTVNLLVKKALLEYDKDYEKFYIEGESKPKEVGAPFIIKGQTKDIGVLLIHGYMAAPLEVANLALYLERRGVPLYVPRLKGHGTSPEDLAKRTYKDWIESVDAGYAIIRSMCKRIVVGGFSTGAALALDIAARVDKIEGVFAVCPPRRLQDPSLKKNLAKDIWRRLVERVRGGEKKEFIKNVPENPNISYLRNPIEGIREIELFMDNLEPKLEKIMIPSLVIHSRRDPIADHEGSRRIFEMIGSQDKSYVLFNFDRHCILSGDGSNRVHHLIGDFIENLMKIQITGGININEFSQSSC